MKLVLQEAVFEAGVELQLHTFFDRARIADDGKIVARLVSKSPTRWAERSGNVGEILRCAQNDGESQNDESGQNDVRSEGGILRCAQNDGEDKNDEDGWNDVRDWNDEDGWNDVRDWNDEDGWNDEGGRNSAREQVVRCQRLIDCSGDGDAAFSLGADYST
ncbi:MAG: FAD-dependent oxidoreductase, partial [Armatimonadetes bacterium]|nr:FAD-dependent oxidoreductase [Armatimonadota bacterium]